MTRKQFISLLISAVAWGTGGQAMARTSGEATPDSVIRLPAVEVSEKRFSLLREGGISKLRVETDLTAAPAAASDAFRHLPSFHTDMEGGVLSRGDARPVLLIGGIPYGLLEENSGDVLIQLPAFFFNRISLLSMPGADYIPDGSGGILSLGSETPASPCFLTVGGGLHERYNAGMSVDLHPGKFRIAARYNYRREFRDRSFTKELVTASGMKTMDNKASARPDIHVAGLSVAYDLTPGDVLSASGLYYGMDYNRYGGIHVVNRLASGTVNKMLRHRYNSQRQEAYGAQLAWSHRFSSPADRLEVLFNYNDFTYDEGNRFENENPQGAIVKQEHSAIGQRKHLYYVSAAYRKGLAAALFFKGGYIGRLRHDRYAAAAEDLKNGEWTPNPAASTGFTLNRTVHLLYASLHADVNRFGLEAGVQGEYTWQQARNKASGVSERDTYFRFYPQARLSYADHAGGKWLLSYTQRVNRPLSKDLNPFIDTSNDLQTVQGNPSLQPEIVHLGELSYTWGVRNFRLVPAAYCRYRTNRILEVAREEGNALIWRKENIGTTRTAGMELAAGWSPHRILSVHVAGNVFWDQIDGKLIGGEETKSMTCWDAKGAVNFHLTPTTELQLDGFYISGRLTAQGEIKGHYAVNAGLSQYLLERRLCLNLTLNNIFDSLKEVTVIDTPGLRLHQERNRDARVGWLAVSYLF